MESRMDQIETKLNDEQKDVESLKMAMSKLMAKNEHNPKRTQLKAWLHDEVGLAQYFDVFVDNGIEDLSTAKLLTMETLKAIGIDKIGHCMKILHQVAVLNKN